MERQFAMSDVANVPRAALTLPIIWVGISQMIIYNKRDSLQVWFIRFMIFLSICPLMQKLSKLSFAPLERVVSHTEGAPTWPARIFAARVSMTANTLELYGEIEVIIMQRMS